MIDSKVFGALVITSVVLSLSVYSVSITQCWKELDTEYGYLRRAVEDVVDDDTQKQITQRVIEFRNPKDSKNTFIGR